MKVEIGPYAKGSEDSTINVVIDPYDTWNMDHTLALIIYPMLVQLKENKHGAPGVDDEDVPEELRSTSAPPKENEWDTDDNWFERWDWVLNEMILAFKDLSECTWEDQYHSGTIDIDFVPCEDDPNMSQMVKGPNDTSVFDAEGYRKHQERINNGCRLFGKYYQGLWD
jgi:hypothetical protein